MSHNEQIDPEVDNISDVGLDISTATDLLNMVESELNLDKLAGTLFEECHLHTFVSREEFLSMKSKMDRQEKRILELEKQSGTSMALHQLSSENSPKEVIHQQNPLQVNFDHFE